MNDLILVPRAAVEALVDPTEHPYARDDGYGEGYYECVFCTAHVDSPHQDSCPVRLVQEALQQPQLPVFTPDEFDYISGMIVAYLEGGIETPPYDATMYSLIRKVGLTQADVRWYDITPPQPKEE